MITTPTLDNFNRADENPLDGGGNWAALPLAGWNQLQIISNDAASNGSPSGSYWTPILPGGDVQVWAVGTNVQLGNSNACALDLCLQNVGLGTIDGYHGFFFRSPGTDQWGIQRYDNSVLTNLALVNLDTSFNPTDKMLFQRVGNDLELWQEQNGVWSLRVSATDTTYTGPGHAALILSETASGLRWAGFGGGLPRTFLPQIIRYV